ncbi:hypothetical protein [Amycolatopsis sp. NBC_00438]|uniref:hypothetical protein n=1 Tax=Amycolatopsis sp. NBC_00438 TaxID=2903558 RepID=UPI002E1B791D
MPVEISSIEDANQLLYYAVTAQLERVKRRGYTQERIAASMEKWKSNSNFGRRLKEPPDEMLEMLDRRLMAIEPKLDRTGGLLALAARLRRVGNLQALEAGIPPAWWQRKIDRPMVTEMNVLETGAALLSKMRTVPDNAMQVRDRNKEKLQEVVTRLILIGAAPPTPDNVEALMLLGRIAGAEGTFEMVEKILENALSNHPLGFRVWRAVTTVVMINNANANAEEVIKPWVQAQLEEAETRREMSLFPARSLDLELAIVIPPKWSPPGGDDWVSDALKRRASNKDATVRERGMAAAGLWERALLHGDRSYQGNIKDYLGQMIATFRAEAKQDDQGVPRGLHWAATTLEQNIEEGKAVCNSWPNVTDEPALDVIREAMQEFVTQRTPQAVLPATKTLFEHALLQAAGVHRRHAIDTLAAGGWTGPVVAALGRVIRHDDTATWLRCRALFAISFLQDRDRAVESLIRWSCQDIKRRMDIHFKDRPGTPVPPALAADMHAALFAAGDCFGPAGAEDGARRLRTALDPMLGDLLRKGQSDHSLVRVGRAAAYAIAVTAQPGDNSKNLLGLLADHADPAVVRLGKWALRRFDGQENGGVRPLHHLTF